MEVWAIYIKNHCNRRPRDCFMLYEHPEIELYTSRDLADIRARELAGPGKRYKTEFPNIETDEYYFQDCSFKGMKLEVMDALR